MSKRILEICTGSYEDCVNAYKAGAKRVELNSALALGGLTPTVSVLKQVKQDTELEVACMVRPRAAGFHYNETEFEIMLSEAKDLLEAGADGIVFGFLNEDRSFDIGRTQQMVDLIHSYHAEAIVHRAFDICCDMDTCIQTLIDCKVDRILTSGLQKNVSLGKENLAYLQRTYGNKIQILAGCGINLENVQEILKDTKVNQVHSSCKGYKKDNTTMYEDVSYSYLLNGHEYDYEVVDPQVVSEMNKLVKSCQNISENGFILLKK